MARLKRELARVKKERDFFKEAAAPFANADRHATRSTLVTSQLSIEKWHDPIGDPTLADAILDRLVHNAHKLQLKGDSLRIRNANLTRTTPAE